RRAGNLVAGYSRRSERADLHGLPTHALQRAQVVHNVPAVHLLDAIVRGHQTTTVANHAEDVAVSTRLGHIGGEIDSRHPVLRDRTISLCALTMTGQTV